MKLSKNIIFGIIIILFISLVLLLYLVYNTHLKPNFGSVDTLNQINPKLAPVSKYFPNNGVIKYKNSIHHRGTTIILYFIIDVNKFISITKINKIHVEELPPGIIEQDNIPKEFNVDKTTIKHNSNTLLAIFSINNIKVYMSIIKSTGECYSEIIIE